MTGPGSIPRGARWLAVPLVPALAWVIGFAWFVHVAARSPGPAPDADGIVVLTGGAGRIETALHLLADGRARRLLVSGVGGAAGFPELARRAGVPDSLAPLVTLGRGATSTRGNAAETAEWARSHALRSLIVVTAGYHLPRAMAELAQALPDIRLYPFPASGGEAGLRLLAGEYTKWLVVAVGLSRSMTPRRDG